MVFLNYSTMQMVAKIVYYGPGLCGKTTNLREIYKQTSPKSRGEMVSLETETDRTLFFDLLPMDVGVIGGFKTKLQLYTVPGQVFYDSTRKLVLRGVDGIVFVADSQTPMKDANRQSYENLVENLAELGIDAAEAPLVFQYNKRDLPNILSVEELNESINQLGRPYVEASALQGVGVFETLKEVSKQTFIQLRTKAIDMQKKSKVSLQDSTEKDKSKDEIKTTAKEASPIEEDTLIREPEETMPEVVSFDEPEGTGLPDLSEPDLEVLETDAHGNTMDTLDDLSEFDLDFADDDLEDDLDDLGDDSLRDMVIDDELAELSKESIENDSLDDIDDVLIAPDATMDLDSEVFSTEPDLIEDSFDDQIVFDESDPSDVDTLSLDGGAALISETNEAQDWGSEFDAQIQNLDVETPTLDTGEHTVPETQEAAAFANELSDEDDLDDSGTLTFDPSNIEALGDQDDLDDGEINFDEDDDLVSFDDLGNMDNDEDELDDDIDDETVPVGTGTKIDFETDEELTLDSPSFNALEAELDLVSPTPEPEEALNFESESDLEEIAEADQAAETDDDIDEIMAIDDAEEQDVLSETEQEEDDLSEVEDEIAIDETEAITGAADDFTLEASAPSDFQEAETSSAPDETTVEDSSSDQESAELMDEPQAAEELQTEAEPEAQESEAEAPESEEPQAESPQTEAPAKPKKKGKKKSLVSSLEEIESLATQTIKTRQSKKKDLSVDSLITELMEKPSKPSSEKHQIKIDQEFASAQLNCVFLDEDENVVSTQLIKVEPKKRAPGKYRIRLVLDIDVPE